MDEDRAPESVSRHSRWRRSARRPWKSAVGKDDRNDETVGLWVTGSCGCPPTSPDGLGLVLHHDDGVSDPDHVGVTALDLGTGRVAWHRKQDMAPEGYLGTSGLALGAGRLATYAHDWESTSGTRLLRVFRRR